MSLFIKYDQKLSFLVVFFLFWIGAFTPVSSPAFIRSFFSSSKNRSVSAESKQNESKQKAQQRIRVALGAMPRSLDPRQATDANSQRLTDLLFDQTVGCPIGKGHFDYGL